MSGLFSLLFWYIDIKNPFEIKASTDSKVGTEKSEVDRMKPQSLGNHQTSSAKKNLVQQARTELCQAQSKLIQIGRVLGKKSSLKEIC